LSLILIGLVPDGLQGYIMSHCPARDSVLEADVKVLISGYGDEFVLLANSLAGLQRLIAIDAAAAFCYVTLYSMHICIGQLIMDAHGIP